MILQQLLSVSSVSLFPSPSPLPSLCVLHFQLFVVISVYWFYEPKHFVNVFIMHRMWQRGRGNFDYALPQLNKLLSHLLFKCFYACVCVGVRVCGWKGHPKLGQVFGARRHHFKSQLSRTHAKAANTLVTSVCARVCVCVLDHVPRPMLYVCVCMSPTLCSTWALRVCLVWLL